MKLSKRIGLIALAVIMLFCSGVMFVGCKDKKDYNKIELNEVTHSIFYAPLYVAINKGFFKEQGLSVSLTNGGGSDTSMSALINGSADIILAGPETVVYTNKEGLKDAPVVFGQLTHCDGSFVVSKENETDFSLDNLVGETIIGGRKGGLPAMTLEYIIKKNGYTIGTNASSINLRTDVAFNLTASVWEAETNTKYCTLFEPTATNVQKQGKGYIVASLGELSGSIPYTCFATKSSYLKNHKEQAEKFLIAIQKAYDFISKNNSTEVAKVLSPSFAGNTTEELSAAVEQYLAIGAWGKDLTLSEESFENLMNVMLNAEVITKKANWSEVVNNTIAEKLN